MKLTLLLLILLSATSIVYGQRKVNSSGNTLIVTKNSTASYAPKLEVGLLQSGNLSALFG